MVPVNCTLISVGMKNQEVKDLYITKQDISLLFDYEGCIAAQRSVLWPGN